jgi:hypothetical protein
MKNEKNQNELKNVLDNFLAEQPNNSNDEMDCISGVCIIKNDKSIVERVNKKIIIEDGRQLLI